MARCRQHVQVVLAVRAQQASRLAVAVAAVRLVAVFAARVVRAVQAVRASRFVASCGARRPFVVRTHEDVVGGTDVVGERDGVRGGGGGGGGGGDVRLAAGGHRRGRDDTEQRVATRDARRRRRRRCTRLAIARHRSAAFRSPDWPERRLAVAAPRDRRRARVATRGRQRIARFVVDAGVREPRGFRPENVTLYIYNFTTTGNRLRLYNKLIRIGTTRKVRTRKRSGRCRLKPRGVICDFSFGGAHCFFTLGGVTSRRRQSNASFQSTIVSLTSVTAEL